MFKGTNREGTKKKKIVPSTIIELDTDYLSMPRIKSSKDGKYQPARKNSLYNFPGTNKISSIVSTNPHVGMLYRREKGLKTLCARPHTSLNENRQASFSLVGSPTATTAVYTTAVRGQSASVNKRRFNMRLNELNRTVSHM